MTEEATGYAAKPEVDAMEGERPEKASGERPSTRELAAALVALGIQEQEGRVHQASVALNMLQIQLQAARIRAPLEIERLAREMESK